MTTHNLATHARVKPYCYIKQSLTTILCWRRVYCEEAKGIIRTLLSLVPAHAEQSPLLPASSRRRIQPIIATNSAPAHGMFRPITTALSKPLLELNTENQTTFFKDKIHSFFFSRIKYGMSLINIFDPFKDHCKYLVTTTQQLDKCLGHPELKTSPRANNATRTIVNPPWPHRLTPKVNLQKPDIDQSASLNQCIHLIDRFPTPNHAAISITCSEQQYMIFYSHCHQEILDSHVYICFACTEFQHRWDYTDPTKPQRFNTHANLSYMNCLIKAWHFKFTLLSFTS